MSNLGELSNKQRKQLVKDLHDFYIPYRSTLGLPGYVTFGLEIEFKIKGYDDNYIEKCLDDDNYNPAKQFVSSINYPKIWKYEEEAFEIIEVISDVLTDTENNWSLLEKVLKFLIDNGAYYNGLGGSHVHVGRQIIGDNLYGWSNFFKLWYLYEDKIIKFTNGEFYFARKTIDTYAASSKQYIANYLTSTKNLKTRLIPKELCTKKNNIHFADESFFYSKYSNKNSFKNNKNHTLEFRSSNLTLNKIIWQNNVNLFCKMLLSCSSVSFDSEKLNYLYKKELSIKENEYGEFSLCDFIFDNDFDKYCFLRQYYKDFDEPSKVDPLIKSKPFWK